MAHYIWGAAGRRRQHAYCDNGPCPGWRCRCWPCVLSRHLHRIAPNEVSQAGAGEDESSRNQ